MGERREGGGVLGGLESLHRYNPHFTDGFLIVEPLQSRNRGVTGRYGPRITTRSQTTNGQLINTNFDHRLMNAENTNGEGRERMGVEILMIAQGSWRTMRRRSRARSRGFRTG